MKYIMKVQYYVLSLLLFLSAGNIFAQERTDSVRISEFLPIEHVDHIKWVKRYQADIDRYADENRQLKDFSCDALFLGSSSINLWKNIYNDMAPMKIIRRSYGGAAIRDMIYNYDIIARGYNPKNIVLYVENDLCGCKDALSVGDTYDLFRVFIRKIRKDYPGTPLYVMSFKPSFARNAQLKEQLAINTLLEEYCKNTENVFYVDVAAVMYDSNGQLKKEIFEADNLHINQKGYDLWTSVLKPLLLKNTGK